MPSGLHLSNSGLLNGTPTTFSCGPSLSVNVADSSTPPQTASATFLPNIAGFIVGVRSGQVGVFYNDAIQLECATEPISWSLVSGTIPPGLQMQPFPGVTSQLNFPGNPTTAGSYTFSLQATDNRRRTAQQTASISIIPPSPRHDRYRHAGRFGKSALRSFPDNHWRHSALQLQDQRRNASQINNLSICLQETEGDKSTGNCFRSAAGNFRGHVRTSRTPNHQLCADEHVLHGLMGPLDTFQITSIATAPISRQSWRSDVRGVGR